MINIVCIQPGTSAANFQTGGYITGLNVTATIVDGDAR